MKTSNDKSVKHSYFYMLPKGVRKMQQYKKLDLKAKYLFIHLCFVVGYKDVDIVDKNARGETILIKKNEAMRSRDTLQVEINADLPKKDRYSVGQIRRCLLSLKRANLVSIKSTNHYTIIKLLVQQFLSPTLTKNDQQTDQPDTSKLTTIKEEKESLDIDIHKQGESSDDESLSDLENYTSFDCEREIITGGNMTKSDRFVFDCFREYVSALYGNEYRDCSLSDTIPSYLDFPRKKEIKVDEYLKAYQEDFIRFSCILKGKPKSILSECTKQLAQMYPNQFILGHIEGELISRCELTQEEVKKLPRDIL